jgi:hypothetical protein
MGFAFPKEERDWLVGGTPDKFLLPDRSDLRYNWVLARLEALDQEEMRELVLDAWRMVVPKRVALHRSREDRRGLDGGPLGYASVQRSGA